MFCLSGALIFVGEECSEGRCALGRWGPDLSTGPLSSSAETPRTNLSPPPFIFNFSKHIKDLRVWGGETVGNDSNRGSMRSEESILMLAWSPRLKWQWDIPHRPGWLSQVEALEEFYLFTLKCLYIYFFISLERYRSSFQRKISEEVIFSGTVLTLFPSDIGITHFEIV